MAEYYALTKVNKMQPSKHSDTDDCRTGVGGRIRGTKYLCHPCNSHEVPKEGRTGRCAEGSIVGKIISKSMKCLSQKLMVTWGRRGRVIVMDSTQRTLGCLPEAGVYVMLPSIHFLGVYEYIYAAKGVGLGGV